MQAEGFFWRRSAAVGRDKDKDQRRVPSLASVRLLKGQRTYQDAIVVSSELVLSGLDVKGAWGRRGPTSPAAAF